MNIHTTLKVFTAAAMLVGAAACSNSDESQTPATEAVAMSFVADISATRATATLFEAGDVVGIIPIKGRGVETAQANIAYTCNGTAFEATPPYYFKGSDAIEFNAYYPYESNMADDYILDIDTRRANQTTLTTGGHEWRKNDYLAASVTADKSAPTVKFVGDKAFRHAMSSIVFKFKAGDGIANLHSLTGYTLGSLVMDGAFDCLNGSTILGMGVAAESLTIDGIACAETATEYTAEPLILLPQAIAGGKCTLTVHYNNVDYTAILNLPTLDAGVRYEFTITIKNFLLEVSGSEIADWTPTTPTPGDAVLQ